MINKVVSSLLFASPILVKLPHRLALLSKKVKKMPFFALLFFAILCFSPKYCIAEIQDNSSARLISSDANGATIELDLSDLRIENKEIDGTNYHLISYKYCSFTNETGKPKLPVTNVFLGVPPNASLSINIIDSKYNDVNGYLPIPVPYQVLDKSSNGIEALIDKFTIDRDFYRQNSFYPSQIALINYEGNIRRQRVIILQIQPVQYNPALRLLRKYTKITVRINFFSGNFAPLKLTNNQDKEFENSYKSLLINYDSAKNWRIPKTTQKAPTNPKIQSPSQALKLFVSKKGIYKLDYATLKGAGIEPSSIDPRTFKMSFLGSEVPIYVSGEVDGRFDKDDYIEFFGSKPTSIYTRWNVYWLTWGDSKGIRMVQKSGVPSAQTATEVTFFKSKVRFEEDRLHHKLQNVNQDANDLEGWFESRDHWFWTGIENGSPKNEVTVKFPVYDLAQSLAKPDFKVELVGCTNIDHEAMISVNGNRVGEEAKWNSQDIYYYDGQIPATAIKEGFDNELRITRIGSSPSDGIDMDSYPYQIYLNWFEIGYFRKLIAVNDILEFSTPEQKASKPIATIGLENRLNLDRGKITPELELRLKVAKVILSENANIIVLESGNKWMIVDGQHTYLIIKEMDALNIYTNEINSYTVSGFIDKSVEVFQISNSNAISKFKDVVVKEYKLNQEERNRLRNIALYGNDDRFAKIHIPEVAYSVTFEDMGNLPFEYIAVSSASILRPDRIELDTPSDLKSPLNKADYVIISHPVYLESAKKLAEWRSGSLGGNFATKVIDVTDIYDEFGNGMVSPHAIKSFLTYAYNNWVQPSPAYILIFGDATYDFLGIDKKVYKEAPELTGFIPTFYIKTTFGQTAVDHWYSTIDGNDGFPDIYLGRIPVGNTEEADDVVYKIIANESQKINGAWRKQIVSIADDETHAAGDEIFQIGLEEVWANYTPFGYDTTKIYLRDIIKQVQNNPNETRIPSHVTKEMIKDAFAKGAIIAQYSGHGGRHVWAHEIIFSITDIEELKETEIYPFLLVFSCYNGYFDVPGELSMAEGMLRAKRKGVVAMLSATRLTYGHGNVVMNNLIFEGIFKDKLLRIGQSTTVSKTRLLKQEGSVWLTQMYEYTLFGDPASRLNIPDYEAQIQPTSMSVSSGGKLTVESSKVVNLQGQPSGINANTTARLILPNGTQETIPVNISNGNTPALSINIPSNATNGTGYLKLFGEFGKEAVIGGFKFNIGIPFIKSLDYEIKDGNLQIYAKVDDDTGNSKLKSVVISWNSGAGQSQSQMVYDQSKDLYKLQETINVSNSSRDVVYKIIVTDNDNNDVSTDQMVISLSSRVNLVIAQTEIGNYPDIKYVYSSKEQKWGLDIGLLNSGKSSVSCPVDVMAFDGNPDTNSDSKPDANARLLGKASVQLNDWKKSEKGTQTARIFVPCTLTNGRQFIFVWIDPPNSDGVSQCNEENKNDNLSSKILDIADVLLTTSQEITIKDTNNAIQATIPSNSVNQNKPLRINIVKDMKIQNNQPSISFIPLPNGQNAGFMLSNPLLETSETFNFNKIISIKILYEIEPIWNKIKNDIGLGNIPDSNLEAEQLEILNKTFLDRVSKMGIYRWYESAKRWAKMPSRPIYESSEIIRKNIYAFVIDNDNNLGIISHLSLDNNANTPVDDWRINFIDSTHYNVEGIKTGKIKQNNQDYIGTVGDEFFDAKTGIRLKITTGINPFTTSSQLRFKTVETGTIEADINQSGIFCLMMNSDNRPPNIKIDVANQKFANGDIVSSNPEIHALISDDNGIDLLSRKIDILVSLDGGDFESVKPEDYVYRWDNLSNDVAVNYNPKKLESGSYEVKIMAYDFNGNLGIRSIRFDVKSDFKLEEKSLMNYPNPFERETDITFHISSVADDAIIKIYTVSGRLIRTLEAHSVVNFVMIRWDGRDEDGKEVANGVYYYKLRLKSRGKDDIVEIGKMLKLK